MSAPFFASTRNDPGAAHAKLGPSAADRWMQCTASIIEIERLTNEGRINPNVSSIYAAEGTVAHAIRELCLNFKLQPYDFVGRTMEADGFSFEVTEDMAEHILPGIDLVREHTDLPHVEVRVSLERWLPGQFGTCDTGWLSGKTLYICDFKYGIGEPVHAKDNRQLRLYALGFWLYIGCPEIESVVMLIDQPRSGGMKEWEISAEELMIFGDEVKAVYAKIVAGELSFNPGSKACRWCPVKDIGCPARDDWMFGMIADDLDAFDDEKPRFPVVITPERRFNIIKHEKDIAKWIKTLYSESLREALAGNPDPGSKAVDGDLGDRFFTDPAAAERILITALGRHAYKPRQIIGFGDIEKHLKPGQRKKGNPQAWAALNELVDRPAGSPKLVPIDHPRPAIAPTMDDFDDLD